MTLAWLSVGALVLAVALSCTSAINVGILAMAHVVTGFAEQLRELGTRMAVVQRATITPQVLDSAFLINVTVGSLLSASVWLAAGPAAAFYQSEGLRAPLQALAGLFVIASLGQVQRALLTRNMRFGKLAAIATIRTALNFFLAREIQEEEAAQRREAEERKQEAVVAVGQPAG